MKFKSLHLFFRYFSSNLVSSECCIFCRWPLFKHLKFSKTRGCLLSKLGVDKCVTLWFIVSVDISANAGAKYPAQLFHMFTLPQILWFTLPRAIFLYKICKFEKLCSSRNLVLHSNLEATHAIYLIYSDTC